MRIAICRVTCVPSQPQTRAGGKVALPLDQTGSHLNSHFIVLYSLQTAPTFAAETECWLEAPPFNSSLIKRGIQTQRLHRWECYWTLMLKSRCSNVQEISTICMNSVMGVESWHVPKRDPSDGEGTNQLHTWCSTLQLRSHLNRTAKHFLEMFLIRMLTRIQPVRCLSGERQLLLKPDSLTPRSHLNVGGENYRQCLMATGRKRTFSKTQRLSLNI